jgi:hypothetical protein
MPMPPNLTSLLALVRGAGCSFVDEVESPGNCLLQLPLETNLSGLSLLISWLTENVYSAASNRNGCLLANRCAAAICVSMRPACAAHRRGNGQGAGPTRLNYPLNRNGKKWAWNLLQKARNRYEKKGLAHAPKVLGVLHLVRSAGPVLLLARYVHNLHKPTWEEPGPTGARSLGQESQTNKSNDLVTCQRSLKEHTSGEFEAA